MEASEWPEGAAVVELTAPQANYLDITQGIYLLS